MNSSPSDLAVSALQRTNKLWQRRLNVVLAMEVWMRDHLSEFVLGKNRAVERRKDSEYEDKGREYLYCHLLLGKTVYPGGEDPLFTDWGGDLASFLGHDPSLHKQLELCRNGTCEPSNGNVSQFRMELEQRIALINTSVDGDDVVRLPAVLAAYVQDRHALDVVQGVAASLNGHLSQSIVDEHIIGLILRYRCIGGFDSNQHGSISKAWSESFPHMTECFASPLNHVFGDYFSVFDEDAVFGSRGNLLKTIDHVGGILPDGGLFEMNPPL